MQSYTFRGPGADPSLSHRRLIAAGAYGEVHEVTDLFINSLIASSIMTVARIKYFINNDVVADSFPQIFARKIIRLFGSAAIQSEIKESFGNEVRAISKLCKPGAHPNIVSVLRQGEIKDSALYYIDMDLCDATLEDFMQEHRPLSPSPITIMQILQIMGHIANGLTYIHNQGEVHRDIKPRNSIILTYCDNSKFISSPFQVERYLENCRFWVNLRRDVERVTDYKIFQRNRRLSRSGTHPRRQEGLQQQSGYLVNGSHPVRVHCGRTTFSQ